MVAVLDLPENATNELIATEADGLLMHLEGGGRIANAIKASVAALRDFDVAPLESKLAAIRLGDLDEAAYSDLPELTREAKPVAQNYYDVMHISPGDPTCTPHLNYKAHYMLNSPKMLADAVNEGFDALYNEFDDLWRRLSRADSFSEALALRANTDEAFGKFRVFVSKFGKDFIEEGRVNQGLTRFGEYQKLREEVYDLQKKIEHALFDYQQLDLKNLNMRELTALYDRINPPIFSDQTDDDPPETEASYAERCRELGYLEGLELITRISDDIEYILQNSQDFLMIRRDVVDGDDYTQDHPGSLRAVAEARKQELLDNGIDSWSLPLSDKVVYKTRDNQEHDVRLYVTADDAIIKAYISEHQSELVGSSVDETVGKTFSHLGGLLKYISDPAQTEKWLLASETLLSGGGDCEDLSIILTSFLRHLGVSGDNIRVVCGQVPEGGHAWVEHKREDGVVVALDLAYNADFTPVKDRAPAHSIDYYKVRWFAFNDLHSWAGNYLVANKNDFFKNTTSHYTREETTSPFFMLNDYMGDAPEPVSYRLLRIKDIMIGKAGVHEPIEKLDQLTNYVTTLKPSSAREDIRFLRYVSDGLQAELDHGILRRAVSGSRNKREIASEALNQFRAYIAAC